MTGMQLFTLIHVLISLIGIGSGLVTLYGFMHGTLKRISNLIFLGSTGFTSVSGFFFPFHGMTPGIAVGILSVLIFVPTLIACRKRWVKTYIVSATTLEFLNVLVLIAQVFQKVAPLHQYAPTGKEPIVAIVQLLALLLFVGIGWISIRRTKYALL